MPIKTKSEFKKLDVKLDSEHELILQKIDELYNVCEKHWKTENKYFKIGKKYIKSDHIDIKKEIDNHTNEHKQLLKDINTMKKRVIKHINGVDSKHFHWIYWVNQKLKR